MSEDREEDGVLFAWNPECLVVGVGVLRVGMGHDRWGGRERGSFADRA